MAEKTTLARIYAKAAFEYAVDQKNISSWSQALYTVGAIAENTDVKKIISNPVYTHQQKAKFFTDIKALSIDANVANFIKVLAKNNRLELLPSIASVFNELKLKNENKVDVDVTSAFELQEKQKQTLVTSLEKRTGSKVKVNYIVDHNLIGGVVVKIGDVVIDGSVRNHLTKLRKQFAV